MIVDADGRNPVTNLLRALPIFAEADADTLRRIAAIATRRHLPAPAVLFRRGDTPDGVYVLLAGKLALDVGAGGEADSAVIEVVRPMSLLGLPPVLLRRPSLMTARALEVSEVLCLAAAPFRDRLEADARLGLVMLASLAREYRSVVHQLAEMKQRTAAQRLGCYLLALAHEQAGGGGGGGARAVVLPCDKRTLASRLGMTPEHLSRAFAVLRARGVSSGHGRRIVLGDPERLAAFARPDDIDRRAGAEGRSGAGAPGAAKAMSKSDAMIAELLAVARDDRRPVETRLAAVDERLAAFRAELDRWAASEPTDDDLLRAEGNDLNARLAERLKAPDLTRAERHVLQHALDVQLEAAHRVPTA